MVIVANLIARAAVTYRYRVIVLLALLALPGMLFAGDGIPVRYAGELRAFFFQRDFKGGTTDNEDFAVGGIFSAEARFSRYLSGGLAVYTSQDFGLNDDDKGVYNLIGETGNGNHKGYSVLGEAYLRGTLGNAELTLGRQGLDTPWLNRHDVRLSPHSFVAAAFRYRFSDQASIRLGHATRMKYKNETSFVPLSESAGFGGNEPVSYAGIVHGGKQGWRFQLWDHLAHELWNDVYLRIDYKPQGDGWYGNVRYLRREPTGNRLAGNVDTWHIGARAGLKMNGFHLKLAVSQNGDSTISRRWGHDTTIANQVYVADRARETAWEAGLGYELGQIGLKGLRVGALLSGADTPDSGSYASPDRQELNLDMLYKFPGDLRGLSLRLRHAIVDEQGTGAEDLDDSRVYLRYAFDF